MGGDLKGKLSVRTSAFTWKHKYFILNNADNTLSQCETRGGKATRTISLRLVHLRMLQTAKRKLLILTRPDRDDVVLSADSERVIQKWFDRMQATKQTCSVSLNDIDSFGSACVVLSSSLVVMSINQCATQLFGSKSTTTTYEEESLQSLLSDTEEMEKLCLSLTSNGSLQLGTYHRVTCRCVDGTEVEQMMTVLRFMHEDNQCYLAVFVAPLDAGIECLNTAAVCSDSGGNIVLANNKLLGLFGTTRAGLFPQHVAFALPGMLAQHKQTTTESLIASHSLVGVPFKTMSSIGPVVVWISRWESHGVVRFISSIIPTIPTGSHDRTPTPKQQRSTTIRSRGLRSSFSDYLRKHSPSLPSSWFTPSQNPTVSSNTNPIPIQRQKPTPTPNPNPFAGPCSASAAMQDQQARKSRQFHEQHMMPVEEQLQDEPTQPRVRLTRHRDNHRQYLQLQRIEENNQQKRNALSTPLQGEDDQRQTDVDDEEQNQQQQQQQQVFCQQVSHSLRLTLARSRLSESIASPLGSSLTSSLCSSPMDISDCEAYDSSSSSKGTPRQQESPTSNANMTQQCDNSWEMDQQSTFGRVLLRESSADTSTKSKVNVVIGFNNRRRSSAPMSIPSCIFNANNKNNNSNNNVNKTTSIWTDIWESATEFTAEIGEVLVDADEQSPGLFRVLAGTVLLTTTKGVLIQRVQVGGVFGESCVLTPNTPVGYCAVVSSDDACVQAISTHTLDGFIQQSSLRSEVASVCGVVAVNRLTGFAKRVEDGQTQVRA